MVPGDVAGQHNEIGHFSRPCKSQEVSRGSRRGPSYHKSQAAVQKLEELISDKGTDIGTATCSSHGVVEVERQSARSAWRW